VSSCAIRRLAVVASKISKEEKERRGNDQMEKILKHTEIIYKELSFLLEVCDHRINIR